MKRALLLCLALVACSPSGCGGRETASPEPTPGTLALPVSTNPPADCAQYDDMLLKISGCNSLIENGSVSGDALAEAHNSRGEGFFANDRNAEARADFDEAIRLAPTFSGALFNRGFLSEYEQRFAAAGRDYGAALEIARAIYTHQASEGAATWVATIEGSLARLGSRTEMERRWALYVTQIQAQNDYANWAEVPADYYQRTRPSD